MSIHTLLLADRQLAMVLAHLKHSALRAEAHKLYRFIVKQIDLEVALEDVKNPEKSF